MAALGVPMRFREFWILSILSGATLLAGCANSASNNPQPPPPSSISVVVSPATANIRAGDSYTFSVAVSGTTNAAVSWSVNGVNGGSATVGTIDSTGKYIAPATLPNPATVTIRATSAADSTASGASSVSLLNPIPVLTGINPASVGIGNFSLTVTGGNFVSGAQVTLAGIPLPTTFVSAAQLTATGGASSSGSFPIAVTNPAPGSSSSSSINLQVNGSPQASSCSSMQLGQGASLGGFVPFPSDSLWNKDISNDTVDPNSSAIINFIGASVGIHPDFGAGLYQGSSIGIPYLIVGGQQPPVIINFTAYGSESDPGPMPIPVTAPIEGYPNPGTGDRHVLVLDNSNCFLYELFSSYVSGNSWNAGSAAVWDLLSNEQRPYTWTSADAAGLPILPGLVRYDEVAAGKITHALRFTLQHSTAAFIPPASHWAATSSNANAAPMGMRMRLKAGFNVSGFSAANQVILNALKKYGMIMADNGSNMYVSGAPDDRWDNNDLHNLGQVTAADFEVIQMTPLYMQSNIPNGAAPQIISFTVSSNSVPAGTQVTLSWQVTGASYVVVSPDAGAVRGTSIIVTPSQSTTYTLYATNAFGRTTSTVSITVH
ncbi:MAG TPA: IPT/TIG domain-containing protein [Candidatus Acidoferrales bacterium]|nr:IPT/TIG domain-containing protein [Candidatus Acidoferrales bacterium]